MDSSEETVRAQVGEGESIPGPSRKPWFPPRMTVFDIPDATMNNIVDAGDLNTRT